jgi:acetyl-CoA C-acetyltransferase
MALRLERDGFWDVEGGAVAVNPSGGTLCTNPIAVRGWCARSTPRTR